jgi:hypothetical protein
MNRPQKTNKIYFELRKFLGDKFPAYRLLRSASLLVDIVEIVQDDNPITAQQMRDFWVPFTEKGVDEVIAENIRMFHSKEDWWIQEEVSEVDERIKQKYYYGLEVAA